MPSHQQINELLGVTSERPDPFSLTPLAKVEVIATLQDGRKLHLEFGSGGRDGKAGMWPPKLHLQRTDSRTIFTLMAWGSSWSTIENPPGRIKTAVRNLLGQTRRKVEIAADPLQAKVDRFFSKEYRR